MTTITPVIKPRTIDIGAAATSSPNPPETLYYADRVTDGGPQPVYKSNMPDGDPIELSPIPSQELYNHSPDGFQWGYGGSGPAQLALALLLDATGSPEITLAFYQAFKWEKVAGWGDSWSITRGSILMWVKDRKTSVLEFIEP